MRLRDVPVVPLELQDSALQLMQQLRPGLSESGVLSTLFQRLVDTGLRWTLALSEGRELVGLAGWRTWETSRGRLLALDDLVVDNGQQGRGIGRMLMEHLAALALENQCDAIELDTGTDNHTARAFYRRLGLSEVAVHLRWDVVVAGEGRTA